MLSTDNFFQFYSYFKKIAELKPSKVEFQLLTDQFLELKYLEDSFFLEPFATGNIPPTVSTLLEAIHVEYIDLPIVFTGPFISPMQSQAKKITPYPMHVAAAMGDITTIQELLKTGFVIEQRDELNLTPLQVAAVSGQAEVVSFLISKGANVFALDGYKFNLNALDLAVMESRAAVVEVLITQGHVLEHLNVVDMAYLYNVAFGMVWTLALNGDNTKLSNQFNAALQTFIAIVNTRELALLEFPSTENRINSEVTGMPATILMEVVASQVTSKERHDIIISEINKINARDSTYQTYLDAKSVFHVLPVHGNYKLVYHKPDHSVYLSKITAEGHWGSFTTPMALKIIEEYIQNKLQADEMATVRSVFESLSVIYDNASLYSKESGIFSHSQDAYNLYKQGQTLLLPTGWDGHFVNIILDPIHEYFIVANCGMRFHNLSSGANIYKIHNLSNVTPELIYSILNNTKQIDLELAFKYQLALDKVEGLWQADQIHGNCAWQSHEPAIEALLYLDFLNQGYQNHTAKLMAHENYLTWDAYQTLVHLKNYFNHDPGLGIEALRDILVSNHTSLFTGKNIIPGEYEQAQYIVSVLMQDPYKKEVHATFANVLKTAKPELLTLFKEAGFEVKHFNKLEISDVIDNNIMDSGQLIGLDDFFNPEYALRPFPGFESILKATEFNLDWS